MDHFDADFFGFYPAGDRNHGSTTPNILETAWRALEDSGVDTDRFPGRIGVFGGTGLNSYLINHILPDSSLIDTVGAWPISLSNDKDFVPTRVAYKLDLQGPAVAINTACSTSLVAAIFGAQVCSLISRMPLFAEDALFIFRRILVTNITTEGFCRRTGGVARLIKMRKGLSMLTVQPSWSFVDWRML